MAERHQLQRDDAIPLYHQIYLALRDRILTGQLAFGAALPTEHELAADYAVSRITARRALDDLAAHRLVERRRRTGTRVVYSAPVPPIEANIDYAIEALIAFGRATTVELLGSRMEPPPPEVARLLALPHGIAVLWARRIRHLDGAPIGVVDSYVAPSFAAGITDEGLASTPLLELLRNAGYPAAGGSQTVAAISADPSLAALLQTEPRAAVIRIERVVASSDGTPMVFTSAQYRGDRYRLTIDLHG